MKKGIKRLIFDLEVSPNIGFFWRTGYKQTINPDAIIQERAIICASWKWEGAKKVHNAQWDKGNDKPVVEALMPAIMEADELVGHNIDRFDMGWFNTRHLVHGMDPMPIPRTVDTLVIARRRFVFNSNRLDYIAQLLGIGAKHKTDYDMWKDIVLDNCEKSMKRMVKYCDEDVRLTEQVYHRLASYHAPKTHVGVQTGSDRWSCPHCGSEDVKKQKTRITAKGITQHQMQCKDCGRFYSISNLVFRHYVEAKI